MKITPQITLKNVPHSEAVEAKIREKIGKLDQFSDRIMGLQGHGRGVPAQAAPGQALLGPHRHHCSGQGVGREPHGERGPLCRCPGRVRRGEAPARGALPQAARRRQGPRRVAPRQGCPRYSPSTGTDSSSRTTDGRLLPPQQRHRADLRPSWKKAPSGVPGGAGKRRAAGCPRRSKPVGTTEGTLRACEVKSVMR